MSIEFVDDSAAATVEGELHVAAARARVGELQALHEVRLASAYDLQVRLVGWLMARALDGKPSPAQAMQLGAHFGAAVIAGEIRLSAWQIQVDKSRDFARATFEREFKARSEARS